MSFFSRLRAVFWKDLTLEMQSPDILLGGLVFSLGTVLVMSFALDPTRSATRTAVGGLLFAILLFSASLTMGKSVLLEEENGCMESLLTLPGDRAAIYLGKTAANALLLFLTGLILLPIVGVLFRVDLVPVLSPLLFLLALSALALAAPGTLVGTIVGDTRARELLLPILLFPLQVPALISCVKTAGALLSGDSLWDALIWIKLLLAYDILFTVIPAALYERLTER